MPSRNRANCLHHRLHSRVPVAVGSRTCLPKACACSPVKRKAVERSLSAPNTSNATFDPFTLWKNVSFFLFIILSWTQMSLLFFLKAFECPYQSCHKRFSRSDNLNQHIRIHRHSNAGVKEKKRPGDNLRLDSTTTTTTTPAAAAPSSYHPFSNFCNH